MIAPAVVRPPREGHDKFLGVRTVIYQAPDLATSKAWFTRLLGVQPYSDEPFSVGFNVAGYALALDPGGDLATGPVTYWGVADADSALAQLLDLGATLRGDVQDVGDVIRVATGWSPVAPSWGSSRTRTSNCPRRQHRPPGRADDRRADGHADIEVDAGPGR